LVSLFISFLSDGHNIFSVNGNKI
ncbi:PTS sugar transporter, partial [Enterococcus faecalis]